MRAAGLFLGALLAVPLAASAQGTSQSRDGLATASQGKGLTNNSSPAGSVNAATGPQSKPAYPSGSDTANPGAAFVRTMPRPASGAANRPTGIISTQTQAGGTTVQQPQSPGVGQAVTPPK